MSKACTLEELSKSKDIRVSEIANKLLKGGIPKHSTFEVTLTQVLRY